MIQIGTFMGLQIIYHNTELVLIGLTALIMIIVALIVRMKRQESMIKSSNFWILFLSVIIFQLISIPIIATYVVG